MCDGSVVSELSAPTHPNPGGDPSTGNDIGDDFSKNVLKEMEKDCHGGDGGDSDVEGDEVLIHESAVVASRGDNDALEPEDCRGKSLGIVDLTDSSGGVLGKILMTERFTISHLHLVSLDIHCANLAFIISHTDVRVPDSMHSLCHAIGMAFMYLL